MAASWSDPAVPCNPGHRLNATALCNVAGNGWIYGWLDESSAAFHKVGESDSIESIPWGFPGPAKECEDCGSPERKETPKEEPE